MFCHMRAGISDIIAALSLTAAFRPSRQPTVQRNVRLPVTDVGALMTGMVKVFGRRPSQVARVGTGPAYGNLHQTGLTGSIWEAGRE